MKIPDTLEAIRKVVLSAHVDQALTPEQRAEIFAGRGPDALRPYLTKIARHAYKITDEEVAALRTGGEEKLFEATVAAAVGAAWVRLEAGLRALGDT